MDILTKEVSELSGSYAEDGVVVVRGALTPHWLDRLREAVDEELKRGDRYFAYRNMRMQPGTFREFLPGIRHRPAGGRHRRCRMGIPCLRPDVREGAGNPHPNGLAHRPALLADQRAHHNHLDRA